MVCNGSGEVAYRVVVHGKGVEELDRGLSQGAGPEFLSPAQGGLGLLDNLACPAHRGVLLRDILGASEIVERVRISPVPAPIWSRWNTGHLGRVQVVEGQSPGRLLPVPDRVPVQVLPVEHDDRGGIGHEQKGIEEAISLLAKAFTEAFLDAEEEKIEEFRSE